MIISPSELPEAEILEPDAALRRVSGWTLENTEAPAPPSHGLTFVKARIPSFFKGMRDAFAMMDRSKTNPT